MQTNPAVPLVRKPIVRGDDSKTRYWASKLSATAFHRDGKSFPDTSFEEATAVDISIEHTETEERQKSYRDILRDQKLGRSHLAGPATPNEPIFNLEVTFENAAVKHFRGPMRAAPEGNFILMDAGEYFEAFPLEQLAQFVQWLPDDQASDWVKMAQTEDVGTLEKQVQKKQKREARMDAAAQRMRATSEAISTGEIGEEHRGDLRKTLDGVVKEQQGGMKGSSRNKGNSKAAQRNKDAFKQDEEDWGDCALNVGHLKPAEHDWDFEGGLAASDDEDVAGVAATEFEGTVDVAEDVGEEVVDSSEESSGELDAEGQILKDSIQTAEIRAADAELEQFSSSEEDQQARVDRGARSLQPEQKPQENTPAAATTTGTDETGLRQRIIGAFQRSGNQMSAKDFMTRFVSTRQPGDTVFQAVQRLMRELCEVVKRADPTTGKMVNILCLKQEFRT